MVLYTVGAVLPRFEYTCSIWYCVSLEDHKGRRNLLHKIWLLGCLSSSMMEGMDTRKGPLGNGMFCTIVPPPRRSFTKSRFTQYEIVSARWASY